MIQRIIGIGYCSSVWISFCEKIGALVIGEILFLEIWIDYFCIAVDPIILIARGMIHRIEDTRHIPPFIIGIGSDDSSRSRVTRRLRHESSVVTLDIRDSTHLIGGLHYISEIVVDVECILPEIIRRLGCSTITIDEIVRLCVGIIILSDSTYFLDISLVISGLCTIAYTICHHINITPSIIEVVYSIFIVWIGNYCYLEVFVV